MEVKLNNSFLNAVVSRLIELKDFSKTSVFAVSTTAKKESNAYLTPIRVCEKFVLTGCVIFDQKDLNCLIDKLDGNVDIILTDSENSLSIPLPELNRNQGKKIPGIDKTTISEIFFKSIKNSKIYEFKPNDITVNAAWSFLSQRLNYLNRSKICILGAGNIGSKLALKLVECGAEVKISRRNFQIGDKIVEGLNLINSNNSTSKIQFYSDPLEAALGSDVLIGASNGSPVIDEDIVKQLDQECLIVDLGKNNLTEDAIIIANESSMDLYRTDVTPAIESFVYELLKTRNILEKSCGKRDLDFCRIVSGGYFARKGDIIVDAIDNPKFVLGIAQGNGLLKQFLSTADKVKLNKLKDIFSID